MDARFNQRDIENQGADRLFGGFPMREMIVYDSVNNTLRRVNMDALNHFGTNDVDSNVDGNTYEGMEDSDGTYQIVKISKTGTVTSNRYATQKNNITVTSYADAWAARATTLTYGTYSQAF